MEIDFSELAPYIVTVACTVISGFASYFASRRQAKADLQKLQKQHELDIEKEREMFAMQKERMELEHKHQLELMQKEMENQLGANMTNTILAEAMRMPEVRQQLAQGVRKGNKKH
ncbi:MAG: hypothetical protein IKT52_01920 [Oscillospiraceae bacterium]|nr:hypothetical protein [Oscillospiraceae bacterium]